jgi:hypothetical protein
LVQGALVGFRRTSMGVVKDSHHELPRSVPAI